MTYIAHRPSMLRSSWPRDPFPLRAALKIEILLLLRKSYAGDHRSPSCSPLCASVRLHRVPPLSPHPHVCHMPRNPLASRGVLRGGVVGPGTARTTVRLFSILPPTGMREARRTIAFGAVPHARGVRRHDARAEDALSQWGSGAWRSSPPCNPSARLGIGSPLYRWPPTAALSCRTDDRPARALPWRLCLPLALLHLLAWSPRACSAVTS